MKLELIPPRGNEEIERAMCAAIHQRKYEVLEELRAVRATCGAKPAFDRAEELLDELRETGRELVRKCVEACGATAVVTQIDPNLLTGGKSMKNDSAYAAIFAEKKEISKDVEADKAAAEAKIPRHTYALQVETTDAALKKILAAADKLGAKWRWATPQSDRAFKSLDKWFEENSQGGGQ